MLAPMQPAPTTTTSALRPSLTLALRLAVPGRSSALFPLPRQLSVGLGELSRVAKERRHRIAHSAAVGAFQAFDDLGRAAEGPGEGHFVVARLAEDPIAVTGKHHLRLAGLKRADHELGAIDA